MLDLPATPPSTSDTGYFVFCYPDGATASTTEGAPAVCPAGTTIPGLDAQHPDVSSPYLCGQIATTETASFDITMVGSASLQTDTKYVVGVAAYDALFNVGPLSTLWCGTPEAPAASTGPSPGGGGCAVGSTTPGNALDPVLGLVGLVGLAAAARRRSRKVARD